MENNGISIFIRRHNVEIYQNKYEIIKYLEDEGKHKNSIV
jgi:hypothetical protein